MLTLQMFWVWFCTKWIITITQFEMIYATALAMRQALICKCMEGKNNHYQSRLNSIFNLYSNYRACQSILLQIMTKCFDQLWNFTSIDSVLRRLWIFLCLDWYIYIVYSSMLYTTAASNESAHGLLCHCSYFTKYGFTDVASLVLWVFQLKKHLWAFLSLSRPQKLKIVSFKDFTDSNADKHEGW